MLKFKFTMTPTISNHEKDLGSAIETKTQKPQGPKQCTSVIPTIVITPPECDQQQDNKITPELPIIVITPA